MQQLAISEKLRNAERVTHLKSMLRDSPIWVVKFITDGTKFHNNIKIVVKLKFKLFNNTE
jgi:hypothetical protein